MGKLWRVIRWHWRSATPLQRRLWRGAAACWVCGAISPWVPTGGRVLIGMVVVIALLQAAIVLGVVRKEVDSELPVDASCEDDHDSGRFS